MCLRAGRSGAPKMNRNKLGKPGGNKVTVDKAKIGLELIEWARKEDSLNLNNFCCTREPPLSPSRLSEYANQDEEFKEYYYIAKSFLADRRERWLNQDLLHARAYEQNLSVYDFFIKQDRRQQLEFEFTLKKDDAKSDINSELVDKFDKYMGMLTSFQERNIEDKSNNADAKS